MYTYMSTDVSALLLLYPIVFSLYQAIMSYALFYIKTIRTMRVIFIFSIDYEGINCNIDNLIN